MGRAHSARVRDCRDARVDRLDPETLRRVVCYLISRSMHQAANAGCERAWQHFYRPCDPLFRKLAHQRCRGCWDVDDRVQDLWRIMIERVRHYNPDRCLFPSWLATVLRNALSDQDRANHPLGRLDGEVARQLPSREAEPSIACEQAEMRAMVEAAAEGIRSSIPDTTYRIIHAHWVDGKPYAGIAAEPGLSVKQVRDRHHRAVGKLRTCLFRVGREIGRGRSMTTGKDRSPPD
jgi:RNA polymerase sigma factor (sigma-70 family)